MIFRVILCVIRMDLLFSTHRSFFTKERTRSLLVGLLFLSLGCIFQYYASAYSIKNSQRFVGDLFLDNLPTVNLNLIIVEGALLTIALSFFLVVSKPRYLLFTVKAIALFVITRSFFVALTHLGIYPDQIVPGKGFFDQLYVALNLQAGYFFSAHTGMPLLMSLIFGDNRFLRFLYLAISFIFGISVLLAHVHYSIDVFAAPFMTYCIFNMACYLFPEDYRLIGEKVS